jgi:hypothetical protein
VSKRVENKGKNLHSLCLHDAAGTPVVKQMGAYTNIHFLNVLLISPLLIQDIMSALFGVFEFDW